ncbi:hypothetical protein AQUCO_01600407v1 [Aquilegia coerulea]|uniref:Protein kinase domain-containing protein n=1 Tax=Aquilegia coerulea TaxID=218851 RepID=A0A2G5DRH7_AQUCA|nr:hypothetical protein AQUCO_01600407v1 [Aquilegia coerulea]
MMMMIMMLLVIGYVSAESGSGTAASYSPPTIAAASDALWHNKSACGKEYRVTCTGTTNVSVPGCFGSNDIKVKIVDYCPPGCKATILLSESAFWFIADMDAVIITINYTSDVENEDMFGTPPGVASGPSQTSLPFNGRNASQGTNHSSPSNSSAHGHVDTANSVLPIRRQFPTNIVIAGSVLGTLIFLAATIVIICYFKWKKTKHSEAVEAFLKDHESRPPIRYRYSTLEKITDSFQNKLGEGGYGSVFKGKLPNDGTIVAVKLLNEAKGKGDDFINEVASISCASHTNCITLLGYCVKGSKRALIYKYMPKGSLDKYIYLTNPLEAHSHLGWAKLYNIAIGIARGLEYLHWVCNTPILHLDIKPGNILLDNEFSPIISDFGLSKHCVGRKNSVTLEKARGTPGYAAPELASGNGRVSHKADVYSYGMMLLEMVGGRKNLVPTSTIDISEIYYPLWIYDRLILKEDLKLCGVGTVAEEEIARKMIVVGLQCIQNDPLNRPSMREVLERLEGNLETLQIPPKP